MANRKSGAPAAKVVAIGVVACLIAAACGSATVSGTQPPAPSSSIPSQIGPSLSTPGPTAPGASACLVGEAWNNYADERIALWDQPAVEKPIVAAGDDYDWVDAKSSAETQATQIDDLVAKGAKVIIVLPQDVSNSSGTQRAIDRAVGAGVAVIAYDRVIDSPRVLLVAFDLVEIGRMEARAILAARPKGNYAIIKGDPQGQVEPDLMASGIHEILQPAIDRGDIKIVAETYTVNWDPFAAQTEMQAILTENQNKIDAVIAESDGMASGAIAALKEVGLDGKVAVAGRGGDTGSLNKVALGTQTVDVWPDPRLMGAAAGDAAVALCKNPDISKLKGTTLYSSPGHNQIPSFLLAPQAITKDNLNVVVDAGWTTKDYLCANIDPSKAPPACR
jgi:D-xylose transport system substrate-binding protein